MMYGKTKPIIIVQGGQWGSEAKGMVTAALCEKRNAAYCVRTGAVNAGHTVRIGTAEFKMQQIPCGFVNPNTALIIGAGAMIYPEILAKEIQMLHASGFGDVRYRLVIDYRAGLHLPEHAARSGKSDRHHLIGATGKGCSEAIVEKISGRGTTGKLFKQWLDDAFQSGSTANKPRWFEYLTDISFADTEVILNRAYDGGEQILLEGTQGTLLDLHLGPYPYTTHKQTIAGQWMTECGLSPSLDYEVVLVMRTFPIRVAGDSGPMPREIDWCGLARGINISLTQRGMSPIVKEDSLHQFELACAEVARVKYGETNWRIEYSTPQWRQLHKAMVSELHKYALEMLPGKVVEDLQHLFEMTTVTRKLRRIAQFDLECAKAAIRQNRPAYIVLTFLNYLFPQYWNNKMERAVMGDTDVDEHIAYFERSLQTRIKYVTTGPESKHLLDVELGRMKHDLGQNN